MKLILVRHGHVEGLKPERFRGRKDVPLTDLGKVQVDATADRIVAEWRVDAVYTSPMGRSADTARAIADRHGLTPQPLPELLDFDYGAWNWLTHDEVRQRAAPLYDLWFSAPQLVRIPGGDTLQALVLRTADALRLTLDTHPDQTVVAVGHDSVNRAMLLQLLDLPLSGYWRIRQDPCCINEIDIDIDIDADTRIVVRRLNECWHLFTTNGTAS
ncbi:MAG TPA: histidine phosphatase family protein [Sphingobium sp.]|nr:histidine phosphatase family protein [Sphingobium sp.]